jgi:lysophospholipase L1-like esterase
MRTILCYGDSNTHGTMPMSDLQDMGRFGWEERWPGVMAAALGPEWRVIEEGLPGRTTVHPDPVSGEHKNGLAVLPALLESHRPLDCVVLLLGTNDLKARFGVPAVEIAESLDRLARAVLHSETGPGMAAPALLVVAPPPVIEVGCLAEIFAGAAEKSRALPSLYAAVARRRGLGFLDAGSVMAASPSEGVHFDGEGHAALGRAVADAVAALAGTRPAREA